MPNLNMNDSVKQYLKHEFSLLPIHFGEKIPLIKWKDLTKTRLTESQMDDYLKQNINIAIVTGSISGLVVVDIDNRDMVAFNPDGSATYTSKESTLELPKTVTVTT